MGRVFQARQISMNRMIALKILRASVSNDEKLLARFQQEARSVSRISHPNAIIVHDFGHLEDGSPYIAMELLSGSSLSALLHEVGRLEQGRAVHIMGQICAAVGEAHKLGVIHRDLKPENVQIMRVGNDDDFAKVLDFGIAKIVHGDAEDGESESGLTLAGAVFGTPHYMSPEQVHGERVDHRTDVYSLGVIFYELLTGKPPFDGATPMAVMMSQAAKPPPDIRKTHPELGISDAIAELINSCLVKDREARMSSVDAMLVALVDAQSDFGDHSGTFRQYSGASGAHAMPVDRSSVDVVSRQTPQYAGQLETLPPITNHSSKLIILLLLLLLGGGGYLGYLQLQTPPAPEERPVTVTFDPREDEVRHTLTTAPKQAQVFDRTTDNALGETPLTLPVKRGEKLRVAIRHEGFKEIWLDLEGKGKAEQSMHNDLEAETAPTPPKPADAGADEVAKDAGVADAEADAAPTPAPTPHAGEGKHDWLKITSSPSGAVALIGKKKIGVTPFEWKPEVGAPVQLTLSKAGYKLISRKVELRASTTARGLDFSLKKRGGGGKPKVNKPDPKKPDPDKTTTKKYEKL